jgi:hypothetical protein
MKACHQCGAEWAEKEQPGFSATCQRCGEFLHSCVNCDFHDPSLHNQCRETQADQVRDRVSRNLCEWFRLADRAPGGGGGKTDRAAEARAKLKALFGKPPAAGGSTGKT